MVIEAAIFFMSGFLFTCALYGFYKLRKERARFDEEYGCWGKELVLNNRRRILLQYLLSRLDNCASLGDPATDLLPIIVKEAGLDSGTRDRLKDATTELRYEFSRDISDAVERLITGLPWAEDEHKMIGSE